MLKFDQVALARRKQMKKRSWRAANEHFESVCNAVQRDFSGFYRVRATETRS